MHEDIEARIRSVLRKEGDELALNITAQELERRLLLRRRARAGRRLRLVAAGIAVVAIAGIVGAGNGWFGTAGVGTAQSAAPATASPTHEPSGTPSDAALPCATIAPDPADQPPALLLGATPGDSVAYGGALGAYRLGDRSDGQEGDWVSIRPSGLARVPAGPPTERLVVLASHGACLTGLVADAVPVDAPDGSPTSLATRTVAPTRTVEFAKPPDGEWLVRVHASFATQSGAEAWTETYFRVDTRNAFASPGTALGNLPQVDVPPGTVFVDEHSANLAPGEPTGLTTSTVVGTVQPRGTYVVDVVCLGQNPIRWSIGHESELDALTAGEQACNGNAAEQTVELGIPAADLAVVVEGDPATAWRIRVATEADPPPFIPPALRMWLPSDPDGSSGGTQAYGRCASTAAGSDQCAGEWFVLEGSRSILVGSGSKVSLALQDGWTIDQARVTAAVTDQVRARPFATEYSVGFVEAGGTTVTIPVDLGRGSWILRVALNATRAGEAFGAYYDLPLVVE